MKVKIKKVQTLIRVLQKNHLSMGKLVKGPSIGIVPQRLLLETSLQDH